MKIADFEIGKEKTFIVAELSGNHHQDFNTAARTIEAAAAAGADAVKLQTYTPDTITLDGDSDCFRITHGTLWDGMTLYQLYQESYTPWEWQPKLKQIAEDTGLICFSSPFDTTAVDFLEGMDVPAYKIASLEITDVPLIAYAASKGKPMILSTGVASEEDIDLALQTCREAGNTQLSLLKCTSAYPAPLESANLCNIPYLAKKYGVVCGLSDHTLGDTAALAGVALGAKILEKHVCLDRQRAGPDTAFSMEMEEFSNLVKKVRETENALGQPGYQVTSDMQLSRKFCRSLFVTKDMAKGEVFTEKNLRSVRPGDGLHPRYYPHLLGSTASRDISKNTPVTWGLVQEKCGETD